MSHVPKIQEPEEPDYGESESIGAKLLSRPMRARVMRYLVREVPDTGATKAQIQAATGVSPSIITDTVTAGEALGVIEVTQRRRAEDFGAYIYSARIDEYRAKVNAYYRYSVGE